MTPILLGVHPTNARGGLRGTGSASIISQEHVATPVMGNRLQQAGRERMPAKMDPGSQPANSSLALARRVDGPGRKRTIRPFIRPASDSIFPAGLECDVSNPVSPAIRTKAVPGPQGILSLAASNRTGERVPDCCERSLSARHRPRPHLLSEHRYQPAWNRKQWDWARS